MSRLHRILGGVALVVVACPLTCVAIGLRSAGNTDGFLRWRLGDLEKGGSARQVVLFAFARSPERAAERLGEARQRLAELPSLPPGPRGTAAQGEVWIHNDTTDFALEGTGHFRSRTGRRSLAFSGSGQLSEFAFYVHYRDSAGEHRAGTSHEGDRMPENLTVVEALHPLGESEATGVLQTADGKLRIRIRAVMGRGAMVGVRFAVTNTGPEPLADVRLSAYANMDAAQGDDNDFSFLDRRTGGLLVCDAATDASVVMAGLDRPAAGYAGPRTSLRRIRAAEGIAFEDWQAFTGWTPELRQELERQLQRSRAPSHICLPVIAEPVEPETRALTPAEARDALERDWLFQAAGRPLVQRAIDEIGWARQLAARLARHPECPDLSGDLEELDRLKREALGRVAAPTGRELYLAVREVKRRIQLGNPVVDFTRLLLIDQPTPEGYAAEHEAIHRMGIMAVPGGRLLVLDGLHPGGHVRKLGPEGPGSVWRPDLSFDARRVLFCYKAHDEQSFHLYEIQVDGSGLRQLTAGEYDDIDPIYLPDGHILFTTTRGNTYVRCGPFIYSYVLARCDADGGNVYLVSYNNEPDWTPALLNDGRVIYSRWEYTDKALWRVQSLWTTNQDGTNTTVFWGNQSVWPDHLSEPRPIPGSQRVMFSGVGHHDWFSGSIGIVDPARGLNFPHGLTKVTCDLPWPECGPPPVDPCEAADYHASGRYTGYKTPYPLSEEDFLVSARTPEGKFHLYLMDIHGNRELIYEGAHNVWHAMPLKERPVPPEQPDRVTWPGTGKDRQPLVTGTFYSADVYEGLPELPRDMVKYLRVFQMDYKTYSTWYKSYRHSGPPVSIVQEDGVKRIVSTVPVEADGSVYFKVPAGVPLHFQLLDEHYRCLQTMRSFTGVLPGERRGCLGCHEMHATAAPQQTSSLALRRRPRELTPPPWGTTSISYERFAQPVLDRYCGKCHQGEGEARKVFDLTLRPGDVVYKEPYLTLVGAAGWSNPVRDKGQAGYSIAGAIPVERLARSIDPDTIVTLGPMQYLSYTSKLIHIAMSGEHHDVRVDPLNLRRLIAWVDACCPYMGDEEIRAMGDPDFPCIEELPIRPRVATAPRIERP